MARQPRRPREDRESLPGIAEVRLRADEQTAQVVLDVLRAHFTVTAPREYSGERWYFQLDTRNTDPAPNGDE
ncbi:hypothetical protein ABZ023_18390 [Streptomyces sp. NPDC006367]|uniref:hypothetical protein n=1 Tax=unclassified Streptomyces TaxID=2593676 RepID=UPI0033AC982D